MIQQILSFEVGGWRYALPISAVREIVRAVSITPLPGSPAVVEGVIDVRGELVPVVDLCQRLEMPRRPVALSDALILATTGERRVALRVERVHWITECDWRAVQEAHELTPAAEYIAGAVRLPDGVLLILDLQRFLSPAEESSLEEALATHKDPGDSG